MKGPTLKDIIELLAEKSLPHPSTIFKEVKLPIVSYQGKIVYLVFRSDTDRYIFLRVE